MTTHRQLQEEFAFLLGRAFGNGGGSTGSMYVVARELRKFGHIEPYNSGRESTPRDATALLLGSLLARPRMAAALTERFLELPISEPPTIGAAFSSLPSVKHLNDKSLTFGQFMDSVFEVAASREFVDEIGKLQTPAILKRKFPVAALMDSGTVGFTFHLAPRQEEAIVTLATAHGSIDDMIACFYFGRKERYTIPRCSLTEHLIVDTSLFHIISGLVQKVLPPRERTRDTVRPLGDLLRESVRSSRETQL